jgi:hypothetical protein
MSEPPRFGPPLDETKIQVVRNFLRSTLPAYEHKDHFDFDRTAQVFIMELDKMRRHTLVVPQETFDDFDDIDLGFLLNGRLIETLKLAGAMRVTLTRQGPRY